MATAPNGSHAPTGPDGVTNSIAACRAEVSHHFEVLLKLDDIIECKHHKSSNPEYFPAHASPQLNDIRIRCGPHIEFMRTEFDRLERELVPGELDQSLRLVTNSL